MAVDGTDWVEPVILWLTVVMPTGSGKSSVFRYVLKLLDMARGNRALPLNAPSWTLDEASFEKMGLSWMKIQGVLVSMTSSPPFLLRLTYTRTVELLTHTTYQCFYNSTMAILGRERQVSALAVQLDYFYCGSSIQ